MDWMLFIIGFLAGMLAYHVLSSSLDIIRIGLYIREVEKNALLMLAASAESIAYVQMIKYSSMQSLSISENTIKMTKNIDDYNFNAWKNSAVSNLLAVYPEKYKAFARFVDWDSAMKLLDKIYMNGQKDKHVR